MLNPIDQPVVSFLNQFARRSYTFDTFVDLLAHNDIVKTGVFTALLFWFWFREDAKTAERRAILAYGVAASCAALVVARALAVLLPFRERPLRAAGLHFVTPYSIDSHAVFGWSAFPSDNATLFFGLATSIFLVSRRAGLLAYAQALVVAGFARVYLGLHYPTDILGGAAIGAGMVGLVLVPAVRAEVLDLGRRWRESRPRSMHTAFCLVVVSISSTLIPLWVALRFGWATGVNALRDLAEHGRTWELSVLLAGLVLVFLGAGFLVRRLAAKHRHV